MSKDIRVKRKTTDKHTSSICLEIDTLKIGALQRPHGKVKAEIVMDSGCFSHIDISNCRNGYFEGVRFGPDVKKELIVLLQSIIQELQ